MGADLFDPEPWIEPFGLLKHERENGSGLWDGANPPPLELVAYAIVLALDVATMPLALLRFVGVPDGEPGTDR